MDYNILIEKRKIGYEITQLRLQRKSFIEIGKQFQISGVYAGNLYDRFLTCLYKNYIRYLEKNKILIEAMNILDFYLTYDQSIAYLENEYFEQLKAYRHDKPPVMQGIDYPPFRQLSENDISLLEKEIVKDRESNGKTFEKIADDFKLTRKKAMQIYDSYYHKKVMKALKRINNPFMEKHILYFYPNSSYKRWEIIKYIYKDLIQDLID